MTRYGWCEACGTGLDDTNPPAGCNHQTVCETCWIQCDECRIAADDDEGLWDE